MKYLENQYELLTEEEKNLILAYKSKLFDFINHFDYIFNNKETIIRYKEKYEYYKKIVLLPENFFVRITIFKDVNFDNFASFMKSIDEMKSKLELLKHKIIIEENTIVYRATTVENENQINQISPGNFISTSLDLEVTDNFYTYTGIDVLYQIKLHKKTPCLITPYSVKIKYVNNKPLLKIEKDDAQKEIILFKDELEFEIESQKKIESEDIIIQKLDTKVIDKNKGEKSCK